MTFHKLAVPVLCAVWLSTPLNVHADVVRVTDGALVGDDFAARLNATGERGLVIAAGGDEVGGIWGPGCPCFQGDEISIQALWSSSDLRGTMSLDGETFPLGTGSEVNGDALVDFRGSLILPQFDGRTAVTLTTPFSFFGLVHFPLSGQEQRIVELRGFGTAALQFERSVAFPAEWTFAGGRYEFAPVPEPATVSLLAFGLTGLAVRRWRRGQHAR